MFFKLLLLSFACGTLLFEWCLRCFGAACIEEAIGDSQTRRELSALEFNESDSSLIVLDFTECLRVFDYCIFDGAR